MEEEKFWTKQKLIILGIVLFVILLIVGVILIYRHNMKKKYMVLETQINNAAPNYLLYELISLDKDEYRKIPIELIKEKGLVTNTNMKDCEGYTIAKNVDDEIVCKTYISCKGIYKTLGYGSETTGRENTTATQTENDTTAPEIKLLGSENMSIAVGEEFTDPGATAYDNVDGDLTKKITVDGEVDINTIGEYMLIYTVSDKAGNKDTKERKVIVKEGENVVEDDTNPPVITFINPNSYQKICTGAKVDISANGVYGYTAYDDRDGNITGNVVISGDINAQSRVGTYTINYSVFDQAKNATTASRTYSVIDCSPAPSGGGNSGGNSGGGNSGGGNGGTPSSSSSSSGEVIRPDVNITVNVTSINSVDTLNINVGATASLNASVLPSNATNKTLTYRSNNTGIATVDGNGNVRGISRGETRVIITASNNVQKAVYIIVK